MYYELQNKLTSKNGHYRVQEIKGTGEYSTNLWKDSWYLIGDTSIKSLVDEIISADKNADINLLNQKHSELNALTQVGIKHYRTTQAKMRAGIISPNTSGTQQAQTSWNTTTTQPNSFDELKQDVLNGITEDKKVEQTQQVKPKDLFMDLLNKLTNFMSEFIDTENESVLSDRFIDTMLRENKATDYIYNYYNLQNHPSTQFIKVKMKSAEWKKEIQPLIDEIKQHTNYLNKTPVNSRLSIYYGPKGTGKTTKAISKSGGTKIVCNNTMEPDELLKSFDFNDGKATFEKTTLADLMENGGTIVLDEINLLPLSSLRFLQGLLDNTEDIEVGNKKYHIHPNFNIIGTMNLKVNGYYEPLPEPLIDRAKEIVYMSGDIKTIAERLALNC